MVEAKEDVNKMKAELAIKNQELGAASKEAEALLKSISESTAVAEKGKCSEAVTLHPCVFKLSSIMQSDEQQLWVARGVSSTCLKHPTMLEVFCCTFPLPTPASLMMFLAICRETEGGRDCGSGVQEGCRDWCCQG